MTPIEIRWELEHLIFSLEREEAAGRGNLEARDTIKKEVAALVRVLKTIK